MRLYDKDGKVFVLPEIGLEVLAGPFEDSTGARLWILEKRESGLSPVRRAVWAKVLERLGRMTRDVGLELQLIELVGHDVPLDRLQKYLPRARVDRKMVAAGEEG